MRNFSARSSLATVRHLAKALPMVMVVAGCVPQGYKTDRGLDGSGGSLVAAVDGVDQTDRDNDKVGFWLKCNSGVELKGTATAEKVRFVTATQVTAADTCWLEVRMAIEEATKLDWDWFGITKDKLPDVGLLYASTEDLVGDDRALTLTVYKLYAKKAPRPFTAVVKAKFDGVDVANIPAEGAAVGSLVCGSQSEAGGIYKRDPLDPTSVTFTFEQLDAARMRDVECQKLVVMVGADNKPEFEAELSGVGFTQPRKGDEFTFSKDGMPFTIKAKAQGNLDVDTIPGGLCLNKTAGQPCGDIRRVVLPAPQNYLVARVKGIKGDGPDAELVTFLVGVGSGFRLLKQDELLLTDMKFVDTADQPSPFTFYVYSPEFENTLLNSPFDEDFVRGTPFVSQKATSDNMASVKLLHIDRVWTHRMNEVTEDQLNSASSARWFALLKVKKSDQSEVQMIVGGKSKYFFSPSKPAGSTYLDFNRLVIGMNAPGAQESSYYSVFGLKGDAKAPAECQLAAQDYLARMATVHLGDVALSDADLDACDINRVRYFSDLFDSVTASLARVSEKKFYVWGWWPN